MRMIDAAMAAGREGVSTLQIRKLGYSVNPWRIGVVPADGSFHPLQYLSFPRRRDGLPVLAQLQALHLPWQQPVTDWPDDLQAQVWSIVKACPSYQQWAAVASRGWSPG